MPTRVARSRWKSKRRMQIAKPLRMHDRVQQICFQRSNLAATAGRSCYGRIPLATVRICTKNLTGTSIPKNRNKNRFFPQGQQDLIWAEMVNHLRQYMRPLVFECSIFPNWTWTNIEDEKYMVYIGLHYRDKLRKSQIENTRENPTSANVFETVRINALRLERDKRRSKQLCTHILSAILTRVIDSACQMRSSWAMQLPALVQQQQNWFSSLYIRFDMPESYSEIRSRNRAPARTSLTSPYSNQICTATNRLQGSASRNNKFGSEPQLETKSYAFFSCDITNLKVFEDGAACNCWKSKPAIRKETSHNSCGVRRREPSI